MLRVSIAFRPPQVEAQRLAEDVAGILSRAGHRVTLMPVNSTPAGLLKLTGSSPDVVHACGANAWRPARLGARLSGAALVLQDVPGSGEAELRAGRIAGGGRKGPPRALLAADADPAMIAALYERLPELETSLPRPSREPGRGRRLVREIREPIRQEGVPHPLALIAYLRGRLLRARGRSEASARAMSEALRRDPRRSIYALYRARALREAGSRAEAAEQLEALAPRIDPTDYRALGELGIELAALGDIGAAREVASRAATAAPDRTPAQRIAALALERAGEPSSALELARRSGERGQERRLVGVLRELDPRWTPTLPASERAGTHGGRRALYLLEASLPHTPSGYAYRSRDVLRALREAGLEPAAATRLGFPASRGIGDWSPVEKVDGIVHHRFNAPGLRQYSGVPIDVQLQRNAECLLELVKRTEPDVILAATPARNGALGRALRSATAIPLVYDVRGFPEMTWAAQPGGSESELYELRRRAETACATGADAVITLSETMRDELIGRGADPESVSTVPHVVDVDRFSPRPPDERLARSYGLEDRFVVGSVTSLTEYEGLEELLRAVARARGERPDLAALIVGEGPARTSLESLADELGIGDVVVFTGRIDQSRVIDHYALLDLFALPRRDLEVCRSVTPLKPFEALAMGIPLLASDLPALAEIVSKSGGGRLAPAGSDEALASAILALAEDPSDRRTLGSNAREYAVASHSPPAAADALRAALGPLLG